MRLHDYMDPQLVVFLNACTRDEALHQLVKQLKQSNKIENENNFYQAIIDREKVVSTGIGMGIAIPHAKLSTCTQFFIAIGILEKPLDWYSLDYSPVRLVFMIGGPDDQQTEYLQLLSLLTQSIKSEERRKLLFSLQNPHAIIELFQSI